MTGSIAGAGRAGLVDGQKPFVNPQKLGAEGVKDGSQTQFQSQDAGAAVAGATAQPLSKDLLDAIVGSALASVLGPVAGNNNFATPQAAAGANLVGATPDPAATGLSAASPFEVLTGASPASAAAAMPTAATALSAATPAAVPAATTAATGAEADLSPAATQFVSALLQVDVATATAAQLTGLQTQWQAIDPAERQALQSRIITDILQPAISQLPTELPTDQQQAAQIQQIATNLQSIAAIIQAA